MADGSAADSSAAEGAADGSVADIRLFTPRAASVPPRFDETSPHKDLWVCVKWITRFLLSTGISTSAFLGPTIGY